MSADWHAGHVLTAMGFLQSSQSVECRRPLGRRKPSRRCFTMGAMSGPAATTSPTDAYAEALAYYDRELSQGVERFLEEPLDACPWCGSARLHVRTVCSDLRQFKPGTFRLDE